MQVKMIQIPVWYDLSNMQIYFNFWNFHQGIKFLNVATWVYNIKEAFKKT